MSADESNIPKILADWLKVATTDLAPPAPERIRTEISAHFAEAVEGHLAEGLSDIEAQTTALSELGDPKKAGKRFRRKHLTETEAKRLVEMLNGARNKLQMLGVCVFYSAMLISMWFFGGRSIYPLIACGALFFMILGSLASYILGRKVGPYYFRLLVVLECINSLFYSSVMMAMFNLGAIWSVAIFLSHLILQKPPLSLLLKLKYCKDADEGHFRKTRLLPKFPR